MIVHGRKQKKKKKLFLKGWLSQNPQLESKPSPRPSGKDPKWHKNADSRRQSKVNISNLLPLPYSHLVWVSSSILEHSDFSSSH